MPGASLEKELPITGTQTWPSSCCYWLRMEARGQHQIHTVFSQYWYDHPVGIPLTTAQDS